jgi:predicted alpha-1,2-mannosidase
MYSPFAGALRRGSRHRPREAGQVPPALGSARSTRSTRFRRLTPVLGVGISAVLAVTFAVPAQAAAGNQSPPTGTASSTLVNDPASLVNPFIGTTNQGNDFPGASAPFGMVQWSPDTNSRPPGGGYEYNDSTITGFSLTHLSGPGCGAEGDIPILPTTGSVDTSATDTFSHANESANAGDYKVALSNGVTTELTATPRTGMAQFTFPATTQANLILKLSDSQQGDTATNFNVVSGTEVDGYVTSGNFCGPSPAYTVYYDLQFSQPITGNGGGSGNTYVTFNTTSNQTLLAKVGISYVSTANAKANLASENPNWNFSATQTAAHASWNTLLDKARIAGGTNAQQQEFYTALYHSLLSPTLDSDVNGQYPGVDGKVHTVDSGHSGFYTNYSGWDIYRSQAQLEGLIDPSVASDTAESMVDDYSQDGMFPKWMLDQGENETMVGDPADSIIADYYAFGATNFNTSSALSDMVNEATVTNDIRPGLNYLTTPGYLPADGTYGCCNFYGAEATTLEYDTADFAISALAGSLGNTGDQTTFADRAQNWREILNPYSGFIQPRNSNGNWTGGFDPTSSNDFVEADSWIYTGMVPFDIAGLAQAKGGNAAMNAYLNTTLSSFTGANGYAFVGNEPSIELPWEYDYTGEPYQTQSTVRAIQDQIWTDEPNGLADGNDDLGAMSAWYVWSALGMFPETPGTATLALGSPMFTQAVLTLPSGNTLTVNGNGAADNAPYVQSATWNGSAWNNASAPTSAITSGGTLNYTLGTTANTSWASAANQAPPSYSGNVVATPSPRVGAVTSGAGTSLCLDDKNSSTTPGNPVQIWGCDGTDAQSWTIADDGTVRTLGLCLDVYGGGTTSGTPVDLYTCNGGANQQWTTGANGSLQNPSSGLCLDDPAASTTGGTQVQIYTCNGTGAQDWTPPTAPPGQVGTVTAGVGNGMCLDDKGGATANGTAVEIWGCNSTTAQDWTVEPDGTIRVLGSCLDVNAGGTTNGTLIQLYSCNQTGAQQWKATSNGALVNPQSGLCLDDPASSTTQGTQLQLYGCDGTPAQIWNLPTLH